MGLNWKLKLWMIDFARCYTWISTIQRAGNLGKNNYLRASDKLFRFVPNPLLMKRTICVEKSCSILCCILQYIRNMRFSCRNENICSPWICIVKAITAQLNFCWDNSRNHSGAQALTRIGNLTMSYGLVISRKKAVWILTRVITCPVLRYHGLVMLPQHNPVRSCFMDRACWQPPLFMGVPAVAVPQFPGRTEQKRRCSLRPCPAWHAVPLQDWLFLRHWAWPSGHCPCIHWPVTVPLAAFWPQNPAAMTDAGMRTRARMTQIMITFLMKYLQGSPDKCYVTGIFRSFYIGWQGGVNYFSLVTDPHRYCHIQWHQVNIYRIYVRSAYEIQAF